MPDPLRITGEPLGACAPQMLAEAYRRAHNTTLDPVGLLGWRLGFVETLLRFAVAVLRAEAAGLGLEAPAELTRLFTQKQATPSTGDWSRCAEALARVVLASGRPAVAPEFAGALVAPNGNGGHDQTPTMQALVRLIELRNDIVHGEGVIAVSPIQASAHLVATSADFALVCGALGFLARYSLVAAESFRLRQDNRWTVRVLRFRGRDAELVEATCAETPTLPNGAAILCAPGGDVLCLDPLVVATTHPHSGEHQARLVAHYASDEACWMYSPLDGGLRTSVTPTGLAPLPPAEVLAQEAKLARRDSAVPGPLLHALFGHLATPPTRSDPAASPRAAQDRSSAVAARAALLERIRGWRFVTRVEVDAKASYDGREVSVDLLARGANDAPLAIVIIRPPATSDAEARADLTTRVMAFGSAFAVVSDGAALRWFFRCPDGRLEPADRALFEQYVDIWQVAKSAVGPT